MSNDKVKLYEFILEHYELEELKELCFYLGVVYDDLEGVARKDKARELVEHMFLRERVNDLRAVLNQQRPDNYPAAFPAAPVVPVAAPAARTDGRDPRRIFISHATADAAYARRLADDLRREGYAIWIAPESIHSGEQWVRAINRGLEESGVMVLVLTPAAAASPWVEMETNVAIELERSGEMAFIPLLLEPGRYPELWRAYQWVRDDGDYAAALAALRSRLGDKDPLPGGPLAQGEGVSIPVFPRSKTPEAHFLDRPKVNWADPNYTQLHALLTSTYSRPAEAMHLLESIGVIEGTIPQQFANIGEFWNQAIEIAAAQDKLRLLVMKVTNDPEKSGFKSQYEALLIHELAVNVAEDERISAPASGLPSSQRLSNSPALNRRVHEKTGIELVRIPAGPFLYGSADSDKKALDDEKPQRTIELPEFWIGRYPVTNTEFARFVNVTDYRTTAERKGFGWVWMGEEWIQIKGADWRNPSGPKSSIDGKSDHPVVQVSWDDAKAFCDWAGLILPAEVQWEKAARGTYGRAWPWGDEWAANRANTSEAAGEGTTPVGKYSPQGDSPYGCADMAGNVLEWTGSWYTERQTRAMRGGSWVSDAQLSRAAFRGNSQTDVTDNGFGFRVAEVLSDPGS